MVQDRDSELLCLFEFQAGLQPRRIEPCFIHADDADGGKVIVKISEVTGRIGIKPIL